MAIAQEKGYFKDEGLEVEFVNFRTGADMIAPLGTGELDAGSGAINAALFNAIARGLPLRLVAEPSNVERDGLVVRADLANQIKDFKDLKGRKVALSSIASSVGIALDAALKKGGLTMKDAEITEMGFPDMLVAFNNRAIELSNLTEPSATQGLDQGLVVRWKTYSEIEPNKQVGAIMYSAKFAKENSEAANRFMAAVMRAGRDYYQFLGTGKGKDEIVAAAIKNTTLKDAKIYDKMQWPGINPDLTLRAESIRADLDWYMKNDFVKTAPPMDQAIDSTFVDYAVQRLGKAQR